MLYLNGVSVAEDLEVVLCMRSRVESSVGDVRRTLDEIVECFSELWSKNV